MTKYIIEESTLVGMADQVRALTGTTGPLKPGEMVTKMEEVVSGGGAGGGAEGCIVTFLGHTMSLRLSPRTVNYITPQLTWATVTVDRSDVQIEVLKNSFVVLVGELEEDIAISGSATYIQDSSFVVFVDGDSTLEFEV